MPLMQVKIMQQNGHFFTGYRCICSLPKKITRITKGDYFRDKHREQMEENSIKANLFSSWGLEHSVSAGPNFHFLALISLDSGMYRKGPLTVVMRITVYAAYNFDNN